MTPMEFTQTLELAVNAIKNGNILDGVSFELANGKYIRKTTPYGGSMGLFSHMNGKDICTTYANGIINISVGKPNTHWLKRDYYMVY